MQDATRVSLKIIGFLMAGFAINFLLTLFSAPGHLGTALAVGIFLTSFGMMLAKLSMDAVILPIAVAAFAWRLVRREKLTSSGKRPDKIELFARVLFVLVYMLISALTGIYVGALDGGTGWFITSASFGGVGLLLAMLLPTELMWADDGHENVTTEAGATEKAQHREALENNEPAAVLTQKVVKSVFNIVTTGSATGKQEK